ncbi:DNA polymerase-4 [Siphonobacter aquaeclarae]|uniref:DNA polymerase IV n=1 Tax=Siphonobacter aquaeclarae TaxID=563176 RepID=A0A1G9SIX2_9BACT|nr:DNA polymerase-4 [Siphonobacter aquaeclarae]
MATFRKIIHIDMDAFYASVEQRDNPDLRGKPVAVGGSRERGVVAAASYEARQFGVRSAMPSVTAIRKCPQLIFVRPRFDVYKAVSREIHEIFAEYTPMIEPLSLDEAYLDVTENLKGIDTATGIAREIKEKIREKTGLTASAGVSFNKFLAKIASDYRKPDGLFVIKPSQAEAFVETLEVKGFHGIGRVTAEKMHKMGIFTGADLREQPVENLVKHFGKAGRWYYQIARGQDDRPVNPDRIRKSIGAEETFSTDLEEIELLLNELWPISEEVWRRAERAHLYGKTVTLKVKFGDFEQITRSRTSLQPLTEQPVYERIIRDLFDSILPLRKGIRLLGISLSNLDSLDDLEGRQLTLPF